MNILVTGASGFIGRHLVRALINEGHSVCCTIQQGEVNIFGDEVVRSVVIDGYSINEGIKFIRENHIDGIIHLAAFVASRDSDVSEVSTLLSANVTFGTIILECAIRSNVEWIINVGTYWQEYESTTYNPVNLYAASKQAFEDIAKYYWDSKKIRFCTLRLYDTYGSEDTRRKIFNLWKNVGLTGEILKMSPGEQIIDISHVDDIVQAFICLANLMNDKSDKIANGEIFAVRSEKRYSLKQLAEIFENVYGKKINIDWGGREYKEREVMIPSVNYSTVPGWKPKVSIEEGIKGILK